MIVPRYWSEAKTRKIVNGRQFTIKRFGWSDISEQDAKVHAESRLAEAVSTLEKEGDVRRIDHKLTYNGAEGIPIREEVVAQHQDVVISRNGYGALCLNTPDVLFADIDFRDEASFTSGLITFVLLASVVATLAWVYQSSLLFLLGIGGVVIFSSTLANLTRRFVLKRKGGVEAITLEKIRAVAAAHPDLNVRVYRTPMGYRILLMNDTYAPASDRAIKLLQSFDSDRIYVQMCKNQQCFRARVSPKPWRIGVARLTPRPGVWPIRAELMGERKKWIDVYARAAEHYASCHYVCQLGSSKVHEKAELVRRLHDDLCKATRSELQIA